jgi:hypothetical protein
MNDATKAVVEWLNAKGLHRTLELLAEEISQKRTVDPKAVDPDPRAPTEIENLIAKAKEALKPEALLPVVPKPSKVAKSNLQLQQAQQAAAAANAIKYKHAFKIEPFPEIKDAWADDDDAGFRKVLFKEGEPLPTEEEGELETLPRPAEPSTSHPAANITPRFREQRAADESDAFERINLKVIHARHKTGFEESKEFPIKINSIIAGRYQILEYIGSAAFSKAVQCLDMATGELVCIKIIKNNKDFFDQSLDEIKLLKFINSHADPDEKCVVQLFDYFYFKEHLFIVCELLRDNLYEFYKYNRESGDEPYFTLVRLQKITRQVLTALDYVHSLGLIHCDLKPENILIKSYSRCEVKVIDFGSSCFITDHLSSYVQSRSYRAPEVLLGMPYGQKIDMWSLGCILAELWTGNVLFLNDSIVTLLARIVAIIGPFSKEHLATGRYVHKYFTADGRLYDRAAEDKGGEFYFLLPKRTSLKHRLHLEDKYFLDFLRCLLRLNPADRPTAAEALTHPWLTEVVYETK